MNGYLMIVAQNGEFAIHAAVSQGNTEFVKMLLKHGADRTKIEKVFYWLVCSPPYRRVLGWFDTHSTSNRT